MVSFDQMSGILIALAFITCANALYWATLDDTRQKAPYRITAPVVEPTVRYPIAHSLSSD